MTALFLDYCDPRGFPPTSFRAGYDHIDGICEGLEELFTTRQVQTTALTAYGWYEHRTTHHQSCRQAARGFSGHRRRPGHGRFVCVLECGWEAEGQAPLDRTLVRELDAILVEAEADVILSSSWRYPHNFGYEGTVKCLRDAGFTSPVIGHTPMPGECRYDRKMSFRLPRGYEIFQVVEDLMLDPEDFIILDDDYAAGHVPPGKSQHRDRWIQTPESTGLTENYQKRLRSMLGLRETRSK